MRGTTPAYRCTMNGFNPMGETLVREKSVNQPGRPISQLCRVLGTTEWQPRAQVIDATCGLRRIYFAHRDVDELVIGAGNFFYGVDAKVMTGQKHRLSFLGPGSERRDRDCAKMVFSGNDVNDRRVVKGAQASSGSR